MSPRTHRARAKASLARLHRAKISKDVFRQQGVHSCEVCGWFAPLLWQKPLAGLQVHHICPVRCGGSDDPSNLMLVCPNCHVVAHFLWTHDKGDFTYKDAAIARIRTVLAEPCNRADNVNRGTPKSDMYIPQIEKFRSTLKVNQRLSRRNAKAGENGQTIR